MNAEARMTNDELMTKHESTTNRKTRRRCTRFVVRHLIIVSSFFLLALAPTAFGLTEENVNITRDAKSGGKLVVDVDFGTIDVAPGDNDKVVVNASRKIKASSKEKEDEYF